MEACANTGPYFFSRTGKNPISSGFDDIKKQTDAAIAKQPGPPMPERWTLHDLRRSQATCMAALGVDEAIIERVLNHAAQTKVAGTVDNVYRYQREAAALQLWSDHFTAALAEAESCGHREERAAA